MILTGVYDIKNLRRKLHNEGEKVNSPWNIAADFDIDMGLSIGVWTKEGFLEAVRLLLSENNTLFESLIGKLTDYPELKRMLKELLFTGKTISYTPANRIFDTLLYNHFLSEEETYTSDMYKASLYY